MNATVLRVPTLVLLLGLTLQSIPAHAQSCPPPGHTKALSGLKNELRRVRPDFSEKKLGYRSFLQFTKAAATTGVVELRWSPDAGDYLLAVD